MNITYTYEIIMVDATARCMEVVYTAGGHQTLHIGARLPYEGETLEKVVRMHAPVAAWETGAFNIIIPSVGTTGVVNATEALNSDKEEFANLAMWEQIAFEEKVATALVKFGVLASNPTKVPVAQL